MSIDVAEYKRFKSKVDLIRQEGDREKGALDATRKRIVEELEDPEIKHKLFVREPRSAPDQRSSRPYQRERSSRQRNYRN